MRDTWRDLETYLRGFRATLPEQPRAILAISGHWEEKVPTVNAGAHPSLLFDYHGFPEHTYRLTWPAPGAPTPTRMLKRGAPVAYCSPGTPNSAR